MIYEYECRHCGHVVELQRGVNERDQPVYHESWISCHFSPLTRIMSATPGKVVNPAAGDAR